MSVQQPDSLKEFQDIYSRFANKDYHRHVSDLQDQELIKEISQIVQEHGSISKKRSKQIARREIANINQFRNQLCQENLNYQYQQIKQLLKEKESKMKKELSNRPNVNIPNLYFDIINIKDAIQKRSSELVQNTAAEISADISRKTIDTFEKSIISQLNPETIHQRIQQLISILSQLTC